MNQNRDLPHEQITSFPGNNNVDPTSDPSTWTPLHVQKGLSRQRRVEAFFRELERVSASAGIRGVILDRERMTDECGYIVYTFLDYYVYVPETMDDAFRASDLAPYIQGLRIEYDNLINICIMVKNAGDGFRHVLTENLPYIDQYTILDTGSTDNTLRIAREVLQHKRGRIYEEPFINFRDSRNRLLDLAGSSCAFNIMLDDTYILRGKVREFLDIVRGDDVADSYAITIDGGDTMYGSNRITKPERGLRYVNKIHEIIQPNLNVMVPLAWGYIEDVNSDYMHERTAERKRNDLAQLFEMLQEDPDDPRTYYYIADSYILLKEWENAVYWFKKRAAMVGYAAERQDAMYYVATISHFFLDKPWEECHELYLQCYEADPSRAEALYFIGKHYMDEGMMNVAFMHLSKAFALGMPDIQISVRKNIYNTHIPSDLARLCYMVGEFAMGEKAAARAVEHLPGNQEMIMWHNIFFHINRAAEYGSLQKRRLVRQSADANTQDSADDVPRSKRQLICFISPGGWSNWNGEILRTRGVGGSEKFVVTYAEELARLGFDVIVFCRCEAMTTYQGVSYYPLVECPRFVAHVKIDACIVNRYVEYVPLACVQGIPTYYVMHDLTNATPVIPIHPNLRGVFGVSNWLRTLIEQTYPSCASRVRSISHAISTVPPYTKDKHKISHSFIYPSFPNRGLRQLLLMWPRILRRYPDATLHVFCDMKNEWVQKHWKEEVDEVEQMIAKYASTVTNHGWVNPEALSAFWKRSDVWFYPCTFHETCCLTSWEAATYRCLAVTNDLAALTESVSPDRGVIIPGDATTTAWHDEALSRLFETLDDPDRVSRLVDANYEWVRAKNARDVVRDFVQSELKMEITEEVS